MKFDTTSIVATLRDIMGSYSTKLSAIEKSQYMATILGGAIGASLDMPSSPVDIPRNYFLVNHSERVSNIIGQVNEVFPINFDLAMTLADNMFITRYRLVFEPSFAVHMLGHLAVCSDDVFPTTIVNVLKKVEADNEQRDLAVATRVLCTAISNA